ncbi:beta-phosphoglucomutase family hydrolase [Opitutaceae bacterium]
MSAVSSAPRAVVFDLDGTLVNSMPMVMRAFTHALQPFLPAMTEQELFNRLGGPPLRMFQDTLGDAARADEAMRRMLEYGRANWHEIQPFPDALRMLGELQRAERSLALWTGRDRSSTQMILNEQKLPGLREVVCGDDLATHKPHPEGLQTIMQRLAVTSAETLYIGDADVDVMAGAELGVPVILIRHGRVIEAPVAAKAWVVVDTPAEAYAIIRQTVGIPA